MSLNEKRIAAIKTLGTNWVFAKGSTYDARRRESSGVCQTLRLVVADALLQGRL